MYFAVPFRQIIAENRSICHLTSAVDAPSSSGFACHLSRFVGRAFPEGEGESFI